MEKHLLYTLEQLELIRKLADGAMRGMGMAHARELLEIDDIAKDEIERLSHKDQSAANG